MALFSKARGRMYEYFIESSNGLHSVNDHLM